MARRSRSSPLNIHESFSDIALLMLATFIFLLVTILITSRMAERYQLPAMKKDISRLQKELEDSRQENQRLMRDMDELTIMTPESQMEKALAAANMDSGKNRKDFDLFVKGLKDLPGEDLHLVVDGTGSMHGVASFLIPVLRVVVIRSGKKLNAISWFSDGRTDTYTGSMGEMFDQLMSGAPFVGDKETIGRTFRHITARNKTPGAYLLIGDEPPSDTISFLSIPSPVFTMPIGKEDPDTVWHYEQIAGRTQGKMLRLQLK